MHAEIELMFLPYAEEAQGTMVDVLIRELKDARWTEFTAAVAFARRSGNIPELLEALAQFAQRGGNIQLTFGANRFGEGEGSDYEAIEGLLNLLGDKPNVRVYLYSEQEVPPFRTFHPKLYLFANKTHALVIAGSSNWTKGGLQQNVELNVIIRLDLSKPEHRTTYEKVVSVYHTYWKEIS